jgi:hypothetical protein
MDVNLLAADAQAKTEAISRPKRVVTERVDAKIGRIEKLILLLLKQTGRTSKRVLFDKYLKTVFSDRLIGSKETRLRWLRFSVAIRRLKRRRLIKVTLTLPDHRGRRESVLEITEHGRILTYYRAPAGVLEILIISILNGMVKGQKEPRRVTATEIVETLKARGIDGLHINVERVGRILGKYLHKVHTRTGNVYVLSPFPIRAPIKKRL